MTEIEMEYLISRYADGTLSEPERRKAIQLIESNPECRRWLAGHRQLKEVLADWSSRIPMLDWTAFNGELAKEIDQKIQIGDAQINRIRRRLGVAAVAGLLGLIGATIWLARPTARKDVPSFIQPVTIHSAHTVIPVSRSEPISLVQSRPNLPKPVAKLVAVTSRNPVQSKHPVPAEHPTKLAAKKVVQSEKEIVNGIGIAPPDTHASQDTGMADIRTGAASENTPGR